MNQPTIRLSVVTITYNAERSIRRTLRSLLQQQYAPAEHIIIDGASTDGTLAFIADYQHEAPYAVSVVSEPDRGLYDAMNKGLARATGDYLLFLNAGDALHAADTLSVVATVAEQSRTLSGGELPAVVYGDTAITDSDGRFLRMRHLRPPQHLTWRSFRHGMSVCHQAFYARCDIARTIAYDLAYRHSSDVDWCIRVMQAAERRGLPLVNAGCIVADFEDGGDTTAHHRASLAERFAVMRRHYGLSTTLVMHAWFVVRAAAKKIISLFSRTPKC